MTKYVMTPDAQRLDQLVATQIIADAEVANCWELVRLGIQINWIGTGNLGRLIGHLRAGNGMTLDDLTIEVDPPGTDRMLVGILDDQRTCSASKMIEELERLAGRAGAASPAGGRPTGGGANTGTSPGTSAAGAEAPDLLGTTPDRLAGDPTAYRAQVGRVRAAAACWRDVVSDPSSEVAARDAAEAELRTLLSTAGFQAAATAAGRVGDLEGTVRARRGTRPNCRRLTRDR